MVGKIIKSLRQVFCGHKIIVCRRDKHMCQKCGKVLWREIYVEQ